MFVVDVDEAEEFNAGAADTIGAAGEMFDHSSRCTCSHLSFLQSLLSSLFFTDEIDDENLFGSDSEDDKVVKRNELDDILGGGEGGGGGSARIKKRSVSKLRLPFFSALAFPGSGDDKLFFTKTPNFFKIQTNEYQSQTYSEADELPMFEKASAVVRWRYKRDAAGEIVLDSLGRPVKESNARIIKRANGSIQFVVGSSVFNGHTHDLANWCAWSPFLSI